MPLLLPFAIAFGQLQGKWSGLINRIKRTKMNETKSNYISKKNFNQTAQTQRHTCTTPSQLLQNKRLSERICLEARRMPVSGVKKFKVVGQVKCVELPLKLMHESPCTNCAFHVMNSEWCMRGKLCTKPSRPDHRSVYFPPKEQEEHAL